MIDAKMSFMRKLEKECANKLTVADMGVIMQAISDVLQLFRMEELRGLEMDTDDMLQSYIASLRVQGRSEKTIKRYTYTIIKFMAYAGAPERNITVYHIRNWIAQEKTRGMKDTTLEGNREVLSAYFGWLFREGLIEKNPVSNVGTIKVAKIRRKTYTDVEMEKLRATCGTLRNRAIIEFLRATGCRISEMTGLNRTDVNLEKLECVVTGKGNKERKVYMDPVTGMILEEYLESRKDNGEALFVGKNGRRLEPGGVRLMLKRLGETAGVDHVHPHKFRRTLATKMARNGMPIQEVAVILGHEKLDTTMKYVNVDETETRHDYRRFA